LATGTAAWSISGITLATGDNVITVTATDDESNTGSDVLSANYSGSNNNGSGNGGGSSLCFPVKNSSAFISIICM
jgi:hypothetical protein